MLLGGFRCCCNLSYVKTCDIMSPYFHDSILITMKNKLLINQDIESTSQLLYHVVRCCNECMNSKSLNRIFKILL